MFELLLHRLLSNFVIKCQFKMLGTKFIQIFILPELLHIALDKLVPVVSNTLKI